MYQSKKILSRISLLVLFCASLIACGGDDSTATGDDSTVSGIDSTVNCVLDNSTLDNCKLN